MEMENSENYIIIGISGKKGSGKTTFANILSKYFFKEFAFATRLKEILSIVLYGEIDLNKINNNKNNITFLHEKTVGQLLQSFGDTFKAYGDNFWVKLLEKDIEKYKKDKIDILYNSLNILENNNIVEQIKEEINKKKRIVISDVRYKEEVKYIKSIGGIIIRLERTNNIRENDLRSNNHNSEIELDDIEFDYYLKDNSIKELHKFIKNNILNI